MYFNAVYSALVERMFFNALGDDKSLSFNAGDRFWETIRVLWNAPNDPWWDDANTPAKEDLGVGAHPDRREPNLGQDRHKADRQHLQPRPDRHRQQRPHLQRQLRGPVGRLEQRSAIQLRVHPRSRPASRHQHADPAAVGLCGGLFLTLRESRTWTYESA
ncbi:MAG: hypothetical protein WCP28_09275 [Actinomycetes bacterium]